MRRPWRTARCPTRIATLCAFAIMFLAVPCCQAETISIDRKTQQLLVLDPQGKTVFSSSVGIGRGGLGRKKSMSDQITPAGEFEVDIILYKDAKYDAVSARTLELYKSKSPVSSYLSTKAGLRRLFENMNSLDFNGDGHPDHAYGSAYCGLNGPQSGPKMSKFAGKPYWYSIAIHGTANEELNIGKQNSGGCVQVPERALSELIQRHYVQLGTKVLIK